MKNVLVFFGGQSCEHDVSVITGVMTLNAVDKSEYNPIPVFVSKSGEWFTGDNLRDLSIYKNLKTDGLKKCLLLPSDDRLYYLKNSKIKPAFQIYSAINCMHGGYGEGGEFTAIIKNSKIPFVCPDLFASSLAIDKEFTKIALKAIGVNCLPHVKLVRDRYYLKRDYALNVIQKKFAYPVVVKPAKLGSSIGISVAKDLRSLEKAIDLAFKFDEKIIIEKGLEKFREINCAVYKGGGETVVSSLEEVEKSGEILSFSDKYKTLTKKIFPAVLGEDVERQIKSISGAIYRKLAFSGVVRIDFLLDGNQVFVNEINSIPGSMAYYLFCKDFNEFSTMLTRLIEDSVDCFKSSELSLKTFDGGILNLSSPKIRK
ncbi:MAG: ATP-grasp domain-containing protein [Clostridia bacterium]|nr:ATP-grasp domain-containing protein [Clostridia bacterium]